MNSFALDSIHENNLNNASGRNSQSAQSTSQQPNLPKRKKSKEIVISFFHYTTINGLQRFASAKTIIGRLFWIMVLFCALIMFSKDIYDLVNQYFDRPVSVVSKINYFRKMNFPAVTVCNVNPIKKKTLSGDQKVNGLSKRINEKKNNTCFKEDLRKEDDDCDEEEDEDDDFNDGINYLLANTKESILRNNGHQFQDFIVACRFSGIRCRNKKYWMQFWDPKYGNCYTFNSRLTGNDPSVPLLTTRKPGSPNGLKLRFNIEINEYIPEITQDAGVKLTITQPNEMPFPLYQSLSLAPGFKTDIALKRVNIKRVDRFNNGSCRVNTHLSENNQYRKKYNASYNVQACLLDCYTKSQIKTCGCAEYGFLTATARDEVCDETDEETEECLEKWHDASGTCDQSCGDPCEEIIYESSVSFTKWPSSQSEESVLESLGVKNDKDDEEVKNNFLAANIFFQRFRETEIEEDLSYELANLLADIGGQIGFWAGLSIISMCELLELFALLLRNFLDRKRQLNPSMN